MYIQLIIFILALVGLQIYRENGTPFQQQNARKKYIIFMMVLLGLQSGLRNVAVGGDTYAYYFAFENVADASWNKIVIETSVSGFKDPGYTILTKLFSLIIPSYRIFLIAIAVFFFTALGRLLYRYLSSNLEVLISISLYECLYYSFFSITGIRQTIATAILLLTLPLILNKGNGVSNTLLFFALLLLASTIHKSAFLFLPVYFLPRIRNNRIVFLIAFALFIPMFYAGNILGGFLEGSAFEQYAHYMQQSETTGAIVFTLFMLVLALAVFFKLRLMNSYSPFNYVFTSGIAIAVLLSPLLILDPNNQRIVQYFSIFGLIVLPQLCDAYSGVINKGRLCFILFIVFALYTIMRHEPYAFFWQDMRFIDGSILNDSSLN